MRVIYKDGSIATCSMIVFEGNHIVCDDFWIILIEDILRIEEATS